MLRKKWIARDDLSDVRDASRTVQFATLKNTEGNLNANQQKIVAYLRGQENQRAPMEARPRIGGSARNSANARPSRPRRADRGAGEFSHVGIEAAQAGVPVHAGAENRARCHHRLRRRAEVFAHAAARRDRLRQDGGVSVGHAVGAGEGTLGDSAGAGDRPHARPWPPTCIRFSATRSPSSIPH